MRRLKHRFEILRGGTRDLPERQQTLRGAIDWSYNLLPEPARALFGRLAVFAGGCSIEAIESICTLGGDLASSILDQIEVLVDSSLLTPLEGVEGQQRFRMMESLRVYAFERLLESGEAERVRCLHAQYFLELARDVEPRIRTAERVRWRASREQDLENTRSALERAFVRPESFEIGQSLTITLTYFWTLCGHMTEGLHYCSQYLALTEKASAPVVRAGLLNLLSALSLIRGSAEFTTSDSQESLQCARVADNPHLLADSLFASGVWAIHGAKCWPGSG